MPIPERMGGHGGVVSLTEKERLAKRRGVILPTLAAKRAVSGAANALDTAREGGNAGEIAAAELRLAIVEGELEDALEVEG